MTVRSCCILLAILLFAPLAVRADAPRVSLAEVVQAARRDPPSVLRALASLERSERELHQARGARLPSLSAQVSAGVGYDRSPLFDNVSYNQVKSSYGGEAQFQLGILDMNRRRSIQAAEERERSATHQVADVERVAVSAAVELYVRALAAEKLVLQAQQTEARRRKQHEAISGLVAAGIRPSVDEVRTEVEAVSARYTLSQRRLQRERSYAALSRALGRDPEQGVAPQPAENIASGVPEDTREAVKLALAHRPDLRSLEAGVRAQQNEVRATLMRRAPTLSFRATGNAGRSDLLWQSSDQVTSQGVSYGATGALVLSWSGLDATVMRAGDTARAQLQQAQRQLDEALLDVRAEIVDAVYALELAEQEAERALRVLDAAERTLEAQTHRYEAGAASLLDLLDAEQLTQTAQQDAIQSERGLTLARLALLAACGTLDEGLNTP